MASTEISGQQQLPRTTGNTGHGRSEETNESGSNTGPLPGEYANPEVTTHSTDARPELPMFWGNAQESPPRATGDASTDVWTELNTDSPSILRPQCLWAYFNLPALSLADSVPGVASVAAQTDGFHSVVQVSSPLLHAPHVESVKDIYFAKETLALVFTGIQLAVDLRGAGEAFEKAIALRDQHMIPSLLLVKNVPAVRIESNGGFGPYGYVTVRKHKAFRWIVSLAPSDARVYDVFEMADGFEIGGSSGLFAIGTWIVDLRTFSALRMLFRSELRHSRTAQPEYLLEAAMEVFGAADGQQEGDDMLGFPPGNDEVTGSTVIPGSCEGNIDTESPGSLPEVETMDDHVETNSPQHACTTLHMMGSPVDPNSCQHDDQQRQSKRADYTVSAAQSEANDSANSSVHYLQCSEMSDSQSRQDSLVAVMPSVEDCGAAVVTRFEQDSDWFQAENTSNFFQNRDSEMECSTDNAREGLLSDCSQLEFHFEERTDSPTHAVSDDVASREGEQQSTEALQNESGPASTNNETNHMCFNSNTSDGEHEIRLSYIDALEGQRHHEAADTDNTNNGESCPVGASNAVTTAYDKNIEKQLQAWIATKGESQSYEEPTNVFARNYPSHEFEYWAVEDILVTVEQNYESDEPGTLSVNCGDEIYLFSVTNTSWAFCRTRCGELGYVPTVAVPDAFRKMFKHTKMYARRTASVDRYCKWKGTILYPGDPVVILADLGKWVLVRDYSRPFRQAFVQRGR